LLIVFIFIDSYPGHDYRQPAAAVFKPARAIDFATEAHDSDEEMLEVEIAKPNEALPIAASAMIDYEDQPYEADVVVDFSMNTSNVDVTHAPSDIHSAQRGGDFGEIPDQAPTDDVELMSQISDNWAEDRYHVFSAEEQKVSVISCTISAVIY
jgi:hypothetical protein